MSLTKNKEQDDKNMKGRAVWAQKIQLNFNRRRW